MIIAVDYTAAAWQGAGIGRYTRELLRATVGRDRGLRYTLFYAARGLPAGSPYLADLRTLCAANPNVRARPIPLTPRQLTILWQRLRLPLPAELLVGACDILHAPDFVLPPTRARTLLTVHDLTFLVRPESAEAGLRRYLGRAVPRSLARADLVVVDSRATGADLARLLGVAGPRVRLIYPGVDSRFRPMAPDETAGVRAALGLPAQFLLFVGTLEPRKNLPRLIEGYALAALPPDLPLLIVGRRGWLYEQTFATVERLGLQSQVRFLDFVDDAHLPALYNLARAFLYPSLYEGFGLPVLEALACGAPVVTAAVASLPEVAGSAAVLVDPLSVASIAGGIGRALAEDGRLRAAGPPQARRFRWDSAARELLACYAELGSIT